MKIKKSRLKQIIKEELDRAEEPMKEQVVSDDASDLAEEVVDIALNEAEIYEPYNSGELNLSEAAWVASKIFLKVKVAELEDLLFSDEQMKLTEKLMAETSVYGREVDEEPVLETAQSGGSSPRPDTDFDLKYTSTAHGERDKKDKLRKKFIGSKPGGKKKTYKRKSTKAEREEGKRLARLGGEE